jgi:uncharacterized cupin superfamily protein
MNTEKKSPFLLRANEIEEKSSRFSHPLNPNSEIHGLMLGKALGLQRTGFGIARIRPGKESFVYHSHMNEEEWLYILSGRGVALLDGHEYEVGPGDFMAFPTPSVAHHLTNPFTEDLVYLMGGENLPVEIADFPTLGKRIVRGPNEVVLYELAQGVVLFKKEP